MTPKQLNKMSKKASALLLKSHGIALKNILENTNKRYESDKTLNVYMYVCVYIYGIDW